jgi:CRISPR-associated exonuclease Cas4
MFADDELIPISALQHLLFCERQCALIHIDHLWSENRLTTEGKLLHERVDTPGQRHQRGVKIVRALPLVSLVHGLTGKADAVEFPKDLPPRPVEHKRGSSKRIDADRVQLCAQALCLEEMLGVPISEGDLFYNRTRRRETVVFDDAIRRKTLDAVARVRDLVTRNAVPRASFDKRKCPRCSLLNLCLPDATAESRSAAGYIKRAIAKSTTESE